MLIALSEYRIPLAHAVPAKVALAGARYRHVRIHEGYGSTYMRCGPRLEQAPSVRDPFQFLINPRLERFVGCPIAQESTDWKVNTSNEASLIDPASTGGDRRCCLPHNSVESTLVSK